MLDHFASLQVYDGTAFLKDHPGGAESILLAAGMDSTDDFNAIHSAKAKKMVEEYYVGEFDDSAPSKIHLSTEQAVDACSQIRPVVYHKFLLSHPLLALFVAQVAATSANPADCTLTGNY